MTAAWIFIGAMWVGLGYQFVQKFRAESARMDRIMSDFDAERASK